MQTVINMYVCLRCLEIELGMCMWTKCINCVITQTEAFCCATSPAVGRSFLRVMV